MKTAKAATIGKLMSDCPLFAFDLCVACSADCSGISVCDIVF